MMSVVAELANKGYLGPMFKLTGEERENQTYEMSFPESLKKSPNRTTGLKSSHSLENFLLFCKTLNIGWLGEPKDFLRFSQDGQVIFRPTSKMTTEPRGGLKTVVEYFLRDIVPKLNLEAFDYCQNILKKLEQMQPDQKVLHLYEDFDPNHCVDIFANDDEEDDDLLVFNMSNPVIGRIADDPLIDSIDSEISDISVKRERPQEESVLECSKRPKDSKSLRSFLQDSLRELEKVAALEEAKKELRLARQELESAAKAYAADVTNEALFGQLEVCRKKVLEVGQQEERLNANYASFEEFYSHLLKELNES